MLYITLAAILVEREIRSMPDICGLANVKLEQHYFCDSERITRFFRITTKTLTEEKK